MKRFLWLIMVIPVVGRSQVNGIRFEQGLSWEQIKEKAKAENKYILVDCYATWCGLCKEMDKDVYPNQKVGDYLNTNFISVKIQMDTSKQDNKAVKSWYEDAHNILQQYKISAFPTYLFFSSDGKVVHKAVGAKKVDEFISLANNATKENQQYYTVLENYQLGKKNYVIMPWLANTAKSLGEKGLANEVARDYMNDYLFSLKQEELYIKKNIEFIYDFDEILNSKDKGFDLFYGDADKIDSILNRKGLSQFVVDYIITKEEMNPFFHQDPNNNSDPVWKKSFQSIKRKYGVECANRNILSAKVRWYGYKKDWKNYTKNLVTQVDKYGVGDYLVDFYLNNNAFTVFLHSNNKKELKRAFLWSEHAIKLNPKLDANQIDTKANLLYKLGRKKEGIEFEEIAAKLDPRNESIKETLDKMKKGEPTWPMK